MDKRQKRLIDRAFRDARRSVFLERVGDIRAVLMTLAVGAVAVIGFTMLVQQPRLIAHATGYTAGQFSISGRGAPPQWHVSVLLDTGATVTIRMPKDQRYRTDVPIKIAVYESGFGPFRFEYYQFAGYAEASTR